MLRVVYDKGNGADASIYEGQELLLVTVGSEDAGKFVDKFNRLEAENDALKAGLEATKQQGSRRDTNGSWMDKFGACKICSGEIPHGHTPDCDYWKLEQELASLKTVARAAHKGQSDFKNYYPERGYSTDASDYNPRAERLKKNIRDLDEALTNHTAKYKLE